MRYLVPLALLLVGCLHEEIAPAAEPYAFRAPAHFPPPTYDFDRNPVTEAGVRLGQRLFEEPRLSRDVSISCASCHQQVTAFADPQHRLSIGVDDRGGTRNAPGLFNLAFRETFMWDGGVSHLDFAGLPAIESEVEMDSDLATIVQRLWADRAYREDFRRAFGRDTITSGLLFQALSQYQAMLVSDRSKYDEVLNGRTTFSPAEARGEGLFLAHCSGCHAGPLQTDGSFRNNGLAPGSDLGRATVTGLPGDRWRFRVPSLRNVGRTPPYMHDGRLPTLEAVLEHYTTNQAIPLTETDRADLVAFLQTLTDWEFLADPRF